MCLEICDSPSQIQEQIQTIKQVSQNSLTSISYERYALNSEGRFILYPHKNLSDVYYQLKEVKAFDGKPLELYPMITSNPYPDAFIDWMRLLFQNPQPFIDEAVRVAVSRNYTGYNVDFEPKTGIVANDAVLYAQFLTKFAERMHLVGKKLQVDVATWTILWNFPLLSASKVDEILTMSTYSGNYTLFSSSLMKAVREITLPKINIGHMITNTVNNSNPFTPQQIDERMALVARHKLQNIGMWRTHAFLSTGSHWWRSFNKFLTSP